MSLKRAKRSRIKDNQSSGLNIQSELCGQEKLELINAPSKADFAALRLTWSASLVACLGLMEKHNSKLRRRWAEARAIWDESAFRSQTELSKIYKFAHFCVMVWRSFTRNRCPVRASALAYASLLALIPMLAVVMSITSTFLKNEGEQRIDEFIVKLVANMTPPAVLETNAVSSV